MFKIDGNNLYLTRGDTAYLAVNITGANDLRIKEINLSVKKNVNDEDYVFQLTAIDNKFIFSPKDTKDLDYGKYYYDIQITTELEEIFTIVEKSILYIKEEITI